MSDENKSYYINRSKIKLCHDYKYHKFLCTRISDDKKLNKIISEKALQELKSSNQEKNGTHHLTHLPKKNKCMKPKEYETTQLWGMP